MKITQCYNCVIFLYNHNAYVLKKRDGEMENYAQKTLDVLILEDWCDKIKMITGEKIFKVIE